MSGKIELSLREYECKSTYLMNFLIDKLAQLKIISNSCHRRRGRITPNWREKKEIATVLTIPPDVKATGSVLLLRNRRISGWGVPDFKS